MENQISLYDKIYDEILPLAVQYRMPLNEFWYGDMRLLEAYQKAYLEDKNYTAWLNGSFDRIAVEIGAKNALATKKKDRINDWVPYEDIKKKTNKPKVTKENLEEEFRKQQRQQTAWISSILNKK